MGTKCLKGYEQQQIKEFKKQAFNFKQIVGKGTFGKVWKVSDKRTNKNYAMKVISKARVIIKKSVHSVIKERQILGKLHHPFLTNMIGAFQDREYLYLIIDYLEGGDLRQLFRNKDLFNQNQAKFVIRCILEGLKYIHQNKIIHRDLKPQNIIFDKNGYCRIADMGISRQWRQQNANETSGTPGYMAPQVLLHQNHSYQADYYAVGIIAYQLIMGKRPYYGSSRKQVRNKIANSLVIINSEVAEISKQCADFINRLIQKNNKLRLGAKGINQILNHPWIAISDTDKLLFQSKKLKSPFSNIKHGQRIIKEDSMDQDQARQASILLRNPNIQNVFQGYQFNQEMYAELFLKSHLYSMNNNNKEKGNTKITTKNSTVSNQSPDSATFSMEKLSSPKNKITMKTIDTFNSPALNNKLQIIP